MVQSIPNIVLRVDWGNKIRRYNSCTLMNELIKCVLAMSSWLTPNNGACIVINLISRSCNIPKSKGVIYELDHGTQKNNALAGF